MNHLMIDIETLGVSPDSVILSVAAVKFNPQDGAIGQTIHYYLSIPEQLREGRKIDPETAKWWFEQNSNVLADVVGGSTRATMNSAYPDKSIVVNELMHLIHDAENIWACDPDFDMVTLHNLIGGKMPFWKYRSLRTIRHLFPEAYADIKGRKGSDAMRHDALEDCRFQIEVVSAAYAEAKSHGISFD